MNHKNHPIKTESNKKTVGAFSKVAAIPWLPIVLLVFISFALYMNALSNGFVYDDYAIIVENKTIQHLLKSFPAFFNHSYFDIAAGEASYRPVATLSYFIIYAVAGLNPFLYHLFGAIIIFSLYPESHAAHQLNVLLAIMK